MYVYLLLFLDYNRKTNHFIWMSDNFSFIFKTLCLIRNMFVGLFLLHLWYFLIWFRIESSVCATWWNVNLGVIFSLQWYTIMKGTYRVAPTVGALQRSVQLVRSGMCWHTLSSLKILVAYGALKDRNVRKDLVEQRSHLSFSFSFIFLLSRACYHFFSFILLCRASLFVHLSNIPGIFMMKYGVHMCNLDVIWKAFKYRLILTGQWESDKTNLMNTFFRA